jgi:DNA-binding NtrC family response regulator
MVPFAFPALADPAFPLQAATETVLVVEDEAVVCELAAEALLDEGYRVLTAADAEAAEAILLREPVDLLFTDIDLARNTNGLALARRARRHLPRLPVLYTSGGRSSLSPADAVPQSIFVPKPYRPSQLVALTRRILHGLPEHA